MKRAGLLSIFRFFFAVSLFSIGCCFLYFHESNREVYTSQMVPPTCVNNGYTLYTNIENNEIYVDDIVPAVGHVYGDMQTIRDGNSLVPELLSQQCILCGAINQQAVYSQCAIPRISMYGSLEGIAKTAAVSLRADFVSEEQTFSSYITLKHQGHASLQYPKKNYTINFYLDERLDQKNKRVFSHWNPEHKYILKANYTDPSHCRNVVCANLWAAMVQMRSQIPAPLASLSNYGTADGFPVAVYLNDEFHGLYTLTLHKDDDLFGMEKGKDQALAIANSSASPEAYFKAEAVFNGVSPWEIEFCGSDTTWAENRLNALIRFVGQSEESKFRSQLSSLLDVESAIDYLIAIYALGLPNHAANDLVLSCYGKNEPWICSLYDMHDAFGLAQEGEFLPFKQGNTWNSGTNSLLWDRLLNTFYSEIRLRYQQLRKSILDPEKIASSIQTYVSEIPIELYRAEADVNGTVQFTNDQITDMIKYIRKQIDSLDKIFTEE